MRGRYRMLDVVAHDMMKRKARHGDGIDACIFPAFSRSYIPPCGTYGSFSYSQAYPHDLI
jgi:hypothetical protein